MKLLVQADDYGISPGVAQGILQGIRHGLIRNTGLFVNMPWTAECVQWILPLQEKIALGIDLNISTGCPVSAPAEIPTLVRPDGAFYSSTESRILDRENNGVEHAAPEDLQREFEAQLQRFAELTGRMPDYIHGHAYITPRILQSQQALADRYGIPYTSSVWKRIAGVTLAEYRIGWYKKPATLENQRDSSLEEYILKHSEELLAQEYTILAGHMGYVDKELETLSSYTLYRINDLAAVISPRIVRWVQENHVELVTYRELK